MAYNKREFIQEAALRFGAALVKCYDETASGIIGNQEAIENLASHSSALAFELADRVEKEYRASTNGKFFYDYEL